MGWHKGIVVGVMALSAFVTIFSVGQEREPITPSLAAWTVLIQAGLIYLILA